MSKQINIEQTIKLANKKSTTVDEFYRLILLDVEKYKEEREIFYLEQFKREFSGGIPKKDLDKIADEQTDKIYRKIQQDVRIFSVEYAQRSIDLVLDAKNEKKFKSKKGFEAVLVLLSTLKEINEEDIEQSHN